jgi:hypothetical protein
MSTPEHFTGPLEISEMTTGDQAREYWDGDGTRNVGLLEAIAERLGKSIPETEALLEANREKKTLGSVEPEAAEVA